MTHEEQEAVRRALAATPPEDPMPPQVVTRLEAVIADLAAVRASEQSAPNRDRSGGAADPGPGTPVTDLEERRRRRWPRVLVAAASVSVLAYGVGAVLQDLGPTAETAMSDAQAGGAVDEGQAESGADAGAGGGLAPQEAASPGAQGGPQPLADGRVVELRASALRRDVLRSLGEDRVAGYADGLLAEGDARRYSRRDGTCVLPEVDPGDEVSAARLDGRRATLVVRAARGGTRVAGVYWCGDGRTLLARTELPARR